MRIDFIMWCCKIYNKHFYIFDDDCITARSSSYRYGDQVISSLRIALFRRGVEYPSHRPKVLRSCNNSYCYNPDHITFDEVDRFFSFVGKTDTCWNWVGSKDGGGYGLFLSSEFGNQKSHRYSYLRFIGNIENELWVLHICDNPSCVNPDHLFLGTHLDNVRDKVEKNRQQRLFGELNGRTILSIDDVVQMRSGYDSGNYTYKDLVKRYGVSQTQVSRIIRKESWSWV